MRCTLITPSHAHQYAWDDVSAVRATSDLGDLVILPGHVNFYATANASPLHVLRTDNTDEVFALTKPSFRVAKGTDGQTEITITAERAFYKETDLHLSVQEYEQRLHELLTTDQLSNHERLFIEDEIVGTQQMLSKLKTK